jgi:uncharacterized protein DUF4886
MPVTVARRSEDAVPRAERIIRGAACVCAGVLLGLTGYVGLIHYGLVRNPLGPVASGDLALARGNHAGLRVLFVGNSFTFKNDLPALVHQLAAGDGGTRPIFAVQYTAGGWRLRRAARDDGLTKLLKEVRWDVVVLQEQSQIPSLSPDVLRRETYPFAHALQTKIAQARAHTLLFMTWGYRLGDRRNVSGDTYATMQSRLEEGYSDLGRELGAGVAPVGLAWAEALRRRPQLELWASDGRHPSLRGSYLAACVFYAVLSHREPTASRFTGELPQADARFLQRVAADVVRD